MTLVTYAYKTPDDLSSFRVLRDAMIAISHLSDVMALQAIRTAGRRGLSQIALARILGRTSSFSTRLVDGLESAGLVVRKTHPTDRRTNMVALTPKGAATLETALPDLDEALVAAQALDLEGLSRRITDHQKSRVA